jgi:mannose-6-phosphate isomerase-like protein (cupin superfamily)
MIAVIDPAEKFATVTEHWKPKIVADLNDSYVKFVRFQGDFLWHHHDDEDELFFVIKGRLLIKLRDRDLVINEGQFVVIPRGVEHMPVADEEVWAMLIEPKSTLNTGNVRSERTVERLDRI